MMVAAKPFPMMVVYEAYSDYVRGSVGERFSFGSFSHEFELIPLPNHRWQCEWMVPGTWTGQED